MRGSVLDKARWAPFSSGSRPIFVTEGSAAEKMRSIYASPYLRHAYRLWIEQRSDLVVLGQSLNSNADGHIFDAIHAWSSGRNIAVGVWSGMGSRNIIDLKNRLTHDAPHQIWHFFDYDTHPLGSA